MGNATLVTMATKGRLYPSLMQAERMREMRYLLACIRERVKAESRAYYDGHGESSPPGWLQKEIAQPMHRKLGMACDALSVVQVVQTVYRSLQNHWKRPDHFRLPKKRPPEKHPANIYVHNQRLEVDPERRRVRLLGNKVGWMRWRTGRWPSGKVLAGRVSFAGDHWYLAIQYEGSVPRYADPSALAVGVDPGIRAMTAHDGERSMEFRRVPERSKSRRQRLDRKISQCRKGSARHRHLTSSRSRIKARERWRRTDRSHKATHRLIDHAEIVGYEDPSAKAWQESRMFGEASREAAAGEFVRQLVYKGEWAGREVVVVPESAASTQTCYVCGERTKHGLGVKVFRCDHCGYSMGRDENAALNVRRLAIEGAGAPRPEAVE